MLKQHGGEGKGAYKGKKSSSKFRQTGGEGAGHVTSSSKSDGLLKPHKGGYRGPGMDLSKK